MNASELRAAATRLRESGYRAERNADMHRDLAEANRLDAEADRLDGIEAPAPRQAQQRQSKPLAERLSTAMDDMERTIGITQPRCWPRKRFDSTAAAHAAALRIALTSMEIRTPEPCQHCNGWHLA